MKGKANTPVLPPPEPEDPNLLPVEVRRRNETEAVARTRLQMDVGRWLKENQLSFGLDMNLGNALDRAKRLAKNTWEVCGVTLGSTDVMVLISERVAAGDDISMLCDMDGMPDLQTVVRWRRIYAEFDEMLKYAEEAKALRLFEERRHIADNATSKDSYVAGQRIAVRERDAAMLDPKRYNPKAPTPMAASDSNDEQIAAQVKAMLLQNGDRYLVELGVAIVEVDNLAKFVLKMAPKLLAMGIDVAKNENYIESQEERVARKLGEAKSAQ